jgi:predicted secreted hydrolase
MRSVIGFALALTAVVAPAQLDVIDFLGTRPTPGYARALAPRLFSFPADHGPHPDFRSEWWYFTGNLATAGSRHFGFQLAFFRFGRGALGIAGAEAQPFRVWLDDWQAVSGDPRSGLFPLRLRASDGPVAIELDLTTRKPLVLQGQDGWDRKGPQPGDASYYYSFTRLAAQGRVRIGEMSHAVTGAAWMDREWSSNALGKDLEGWDWFSIQLSDGSDLMYYRLRRPDGTATPFSSGALILPAGDILELGGDDIRLEVRREWRSPRSQRRYPVAWAIQIPSRGLALEVEPQLDQQELDLTTRYWEGAIRARGTSIGGPVSGQGYLELVGY